jgi:hypothetical protein
MKFELNVSQVAKFREWREKQEAKSETLDATGFRWKFCFVPSGFGLMETVVDLNTGEELELWEEI